MLLDIIIAILIVLFIVFLWLIYTRIFGAEFYSTPKRVRRTMLNMLKLSKKDIFYDLGAGFGTVLLEAAPRVKQSIGFEIDPLRFLIILIRLKLRKIKNVKMIHGNIFKSKLEPKSKIFVFLSKETNEKLGEKLRSELKEAIIVSYKWPVRGLKIVEKDNRHRIYRHKI